MLTTCAQLRCKCVEYSESFVSLWLQVLLLPLLCRKYPQTGNFPWYMTDSTAVLEDSYSEVVVNVLDLALNWQLFSDVGRP